MPKVGVRDTYALEPQTVNDSIWCFLYAFSVIIVLTQLEGSGGFSIAHRLTHRVALQSGLHDWAPPGTEHLPRLDNSIDGLHAPRPL